MVGAGAAFIISAIGQSVFPQKQKEQASLSPQVAAIADFDAGQPGAGRTQASRQPVTEHQIVVGRRTVSGPIVVLHLATDDEGRADGYLYSVVVLAAHRVRAIGDVFLGNKLESDGSLAGLVRTDRHLGDRRDAVLCPALGPEWVDRWTIRQKPAEHGFTVLQVALSPSILGPRRRSL